MYTSFFGLQEPPFAITPDPRYLFMSERHREAFAHLLYGIKHDGGFILLTGEVGTGKTTVCRCLLEQVPDGTDIAFIFNPRLTVLELLASICDEFQIDYPPATTSIKVFVDAINHFLLAQHSQGRRSVLVLDEAQNLDWEVLEQIRLLTNLETSQRKLLQIIMLGQPELLTKLARPDLRQLAQRICARYHLGPLNAAEVDAYIRHRLKVAGADRRIFQFGCARRIHALSGGVPRLVNLICDRALLGAFSLEQATVSQATVRKAAGEVLGEAGHGSPRRWLRPVAVGVGLLLFVVLLVVPRPWRAVTHGPQSPGAGHRKQVVDPVSPRSKQDEESVGQGWAGDTRTFQPKPIVADGNSERPAKSDAGGLAVQGLPGSQAVLTTLEWPLDEPVERSRELAYGALFRRWGVAFDGARQEPCRQARAQGLACYQGQGDFETLLLFNRPVILQLYNENWRQFYAAMVSVSGRRATVIVGREKWIINLDQVGLRWSGHFALLWRPPPAYTGSLRTGARGPVVAWIQRRLQEVTAAASWQQPGLYDDQTMTAVRAFQADQGLPADGVSGVQTLIRLNSLTAEGIPLLLAGEK